MANRNYNRNWNRDYDQDDDNYGYYPGRYGNQQNYGGTRRYNQGSYNRYNQGFYDTNLENYGYGQGNYGQGRNTNRYNQSYYGNQGYNTDYDYDDYDLYEPETWTYSEFWYIPGPYTGMGPQGYQRSDQRIEEDINDRLTQHGHLDARDINVKVNNGEATLTGSVNSRREKRLAEDIADTVSGVQDVHNNLKVNRQGQTNQGQKQNRGMQKKQTKAGEIRTGMDVVGKNGKMVGSVKEIRDQDFLVDRSGARDVFVPFSACSKIDQQIHLNVTADQVDDQGWQEPNLVGSGTQSQGQNQ